MFQVFSRSWKGLNLSPGERAAMKLTEGLVVTAVGSGVLVAVQQVATGNVNIRTIALLAGGSAFGTLYGAVKKYLAAQTDVPLAAPSLAAPPAAVLAQETQKIATPAPVAPPRFTTPVPQPVQLPPGFDATTTAVQPMPSQFIPMPQAGGAYVPPPLDRDWSGLMPSVTSQPTERIPTP